MLQVHDSPSGPFAHQALQLAKLQMGPDVIYTSSKAPQEFIEALQKPYGDEMQSGQTHEQHTMKLCLERSNIFQWQKAVRSLQQLEIASPGSMETQPFSAALLTADNEVQKVVNAPAAPFVSHDWSWR